MPQLGHSIPETIDGVFQQYTIGGGTTFDYQLAAVIEALTGNTHFRLKDPIGNMTTIEDV